MLPLIASAYLAFIVGLFAGFSGIAWIAVVSAIAIAAAATLRQKLNLFSLALLLGSGAAIAVITPAQQHASRNHAAPSGLLERLRARAGRAIDRDFGNDAPLARALLIADQSELDLRIRDKYAAAGLVHMLSISGLHVAVIAAAMQLIFQVAGAGRRSSLVASVILTGVYVLIIGAPPPAVRSALMLSAGAFSKILQRPSSQWAALAVGAFVPLINPRTVLDVGYQLSVVGICALFAASKINRRFTAKKLRGIKRKIANDLVTSSVACFATAPLVAWTFGRLSLIGPVSNLVAGPVLTLVQPMLFLALLLAPLPAAAEFVAGATHPLLAAFNNVASWSAAIPFASVDIATTTPGAVLAAVAVVAGLLAAASRFPMRPAIAGAGALSILIWLHVLPGPANGKVELHVLDVGQGDAILIRTDRGRWILFDAGPAWRTGDAGRNVINPYLLHRGGTLEAFVLSHPHTDHVGGAASVLNVLRPHDYWDAAFAGGSEAYIASLTTAGREGIAWHRVHLGKDLLFDGVRIRFLAPDSAWTVSLHDPNLASTIALVTYGDVRFLLVGDAEKLEEDWLLAHAGDDLHADILKVGHHGSATSTSDAFLAAVHPRAALISVGVHNMYHHPSPDIIRALRLSGAEVLRTDESGTIVASTDGHTIQLEARGEKWALPGASSNQLPERRSSYRGN
ncbi:MAG: DNA internalization-related competence protein ComEC/Rec2 [Gemmatimonadaceae bacterium]|nr:DNA internalization-related competence protein ComEC/Rec2 [Gemmatimonadaceae bacterium]